MVQVLQRHLSFIVSTNGQDDCARKLEDYEAIGIPEYGIVDYWALGGKRFIRYPKRPTVTVNSLVEGRYQATAFSSVTYYSQCRPISCLARIPLNCRPYMKSEKAVNSFKRGVSWSRGASMS